MIKKDKSIRQLFIIFFMFSLILAISYSIIEDNFFARGAQKVALQNAVKKTKEREGVFLSFFAQSEKVLYAINNLSIFKEYIKSKKDKKLIENILLSYSASNTNYKDITYIDAKGNEKIKISRLSPNILPYIVKDKNLKNISKSNYFQKIPNKTPSKVWFENFKFDLKNQMPSIKAILPVYKDKKFQGILLIDFFMKDFFKKLTNTPLYDMVVFDNNGYSLYHYQHGKCWGYYKKPKYNMSSEFSKHFDIILSNDLICTDEFVSRKLNTKVDGGIGLILKLKESYAKEQLDIKRKQHITVSFMIFALSMILTFFIIKIFSKTLLNLDQLNTLNHRLKQLSLKKNIILKSSKVGIWEWDYTNDTLTWDSQMYSIYGIKKYKREITYQNWLYMIDPDDLERVEKSLHESIGFHKEFYTYFWITTDDGDKKYIKALGINEYGEDGNVVKVVGTNQDVTDLKLAEQKYRTILELASDGVHIVDEDGYLIEHSKNFADTLGYSDDELKGMHVSEWDVAFTPEQIAKILPNLLYSSQTFETKQKRKDGTIVDVQISAKGIMINNKRHLYASQRDITKNKKYEQKILEQSHELQQKNDLLNTQYKELEESEQKIKKINESLEKMVEKKTEENFKQFQILQHQSKLASMGEMIGAIAHQWRQPLNALGIRIQKLKFNYHKNQIDEDFILKFIDENKQTIEFMSKTIDNFRSFFRVDKAKSEFDVRESIEDVTNMITAQLKHHNISLEIIGDTFVIDGYKTEFQQVILNIVSNAKDILIKKNITDPKITIKLYHDNLVTIEDNGGGIEFDILDRVFEPYFTTKEQGEGTGMGLYMSKMIIEDNMNGKLYASNNEFGAIFIIEMSGEKG
jgi:PAS domain S-box-containing protein